MRAHLLGMLLVLSVGCAHGSSSVTPVGHTDVHGDPSLIIPVKFRHRIHPPPRHDFETLPVESNEELKWSGDEVVAPRTDCLSNYMWSHDFQDYTYWYDDYRRAESPDGSPRPELGDLHYDEKLIVDASRVLPQKKVEQLEQRPGQEVLVWTAPLLDPTVPFTGMFSNKRRQLAEIGVTFCRMHRTVGLPRRYSLPLEEFEADFLPELRDPPEWYHVEDVSSKAPDDLCYVSDVLVSDGFILNLYDANENPVRLDPELDGELAAEIFGPDVSINKKGQIVQHGPVAIGYRLRRLKGEGEANDLDQRVDGWGDVIENEH